MTAKILFYVIISIAGQERPITFEYEVEGWEECIYEAGEFAAKPSHEMLIRGGQLQVGCITQFPPSEEH